MMSGRLAVIVFIALTAICWGIYGPVLLEGQAEMQGRLRPFICVGLAYFAIAVVVPIVLLRARGETGSWTSRGASWSVLAGAVGAIGALGIILAFSFKGKPVFVMPLVFGLAPVVNTFLTMYLGGTMKQTSPIFLAGLIIVALGAAVVLIAKPSPHGGPKVEISDERIVVEISDEVGGEPKTESFTAKNEEELETLSPKAYAAYRKYVDNKMTAADLFWSIVFVVMTALCWGAYGPVLHKGQVAMHGSRLRPFICVGLAYFIIAVVVPAILIRGFGFEPSSEFGFKGTVWSLAGGAAGAIGALGIILAFNAGGRPVFVMPLVFGGAPVVNSLAEIAGKRMYDQIHPLFYAGLILVVAGAVTVLLFAPKPAQPTTEH